MYDMLCYAKTTIFFLIRFIKFGLPKFILFPNPRKKNKLFFALQLLAEGILLSLFGKDVY